MLHTPLRVVATIVAAWILSGLHSSSTRAEQTLTADDLFPTDRVIDVQITLDPSDWDTIRKQSRNMFEALGEKRKQGPIDSPYTYVQADVTIDGVKYPRVGVRKKGFIGSQSSSRPSLKIKLNHNDPNGGVDGLTSLTLNNNKQDTTLVSQFLGYAFFNAVGSPATRCAFASVTVNGKHLGVYSHVESMKKPLMQRLFGSDQGTLYEGTVVDFVEGWENSFEHKFGDDQLGRKHIGQLTELLQHRDAPEVELQAVSELVDLDAFFRFWAVEGLLGAWDGYSGNGNNFFFYLNPKTDKLHFLPWGIDALFEKHSKIAHDPESPLSVKTKGALAHKLYQTEAGRKRYAEQLHSLLEHHWDEEKLLAEIDRVETLLKPHLGESQQEHASAIERVRKFVRSRRKELRDEIAAGMPLWAKVPEPPMVIPATFAEDSDSLWNAAKSGDIAAIETQLADGVEVDARHRSGATALSMAAVAGEVEAVKLLIDQGANVDAKNRDGNAPLHGAAFMGRIEVARLLIDQQADINIQNNEGKTPWDTAAEPWNDQIEGMVNFIGTIMQIETEPHLVKSRRPQVAALLRAKGALSGTDMPKLAGKDIWQSAKLGNLEALKQHLADDAEQANALDTNGISALSWASMADQAEAVEFLLANGASINTKNRDGSTALHGAAFLGRLEVVQLLVEHAPEMNVKNGMGQTALDGVNDEWNDTLKNITTFIVGFLKVDIDFEQLKAARPKIAKLLREHGGKTSVELQ